jgi:hypothetical protein
VSQYLWAVLFYILAKLCESKDNAIFFATGGRVSGHSVKHVLAGVATLAVALILLRRELASTSAVGAPVGL